MKLTAQGKRIRDGYGLIAPLMLGYLIFYVIPFMLVIYYSFSKGSVGFVGLANYMDMAANDVFRLAFGNSMRFLAISLPLILVLSYAIALLLKNQARSTSFSSP